MPVDLLQRRPRFGERARLLPLGVNRDVGLVDLQPDRHVVRIDPDRRREPPPVLDHGGVRVIREHADVQRVVRSLTDPTDPRPEPDDPPPLGSGPQIGPKPPNPISFDPLHPQRANHIVLMGRKPAISRFSAHRHGGSGFVSAAARATRSSSARVGAAPSSLAVRAAVQAAADGGAGEAGGGQVGAGDVQGDLAPGEPVVEPGRARRRGRGRARSGRGRGPAARPPTVDGARERSWPAVALPRRRSALAPGAGPSAAARIASARSASSDHGGAAIRRLTSRARAKDSPPGRGSTRPQPASSSSPRVALSSAASLRSSDQRRSGVIVAEVGRQQPARASPARSPGRSGPRSGRRGSRGSGRRRRSPRGSPAARPLRGRPGRRRGRSARAVSASGIAIALTVKSRRARSTRIGAPSSTSGSAPGRG